jgi:hypothetical protein
MLVTAMFVFIKARDTFLYRIWNHYLRISGAIILEMPVVTTDQFEGKVLFLQIKLQQKAMS